MYNPLDTAWILIGSALIFFMQAGFCMLETGFTRAKNAGNIALKNLSDAAIGSVAFLILGFGFMFGNGNGFIGGIDFFARNSGGAEGVPHAAFVIFEIVFCATSATIVSGAMAGRTRFSAYCVFSLIMSLFIYPISGHWIWGGGWLSQLGFHDLAGGTAVHIVGGTAAFVGAKMVGARAGKYNSDGSSNGLYGQSLTFSVLGAMILWFSWFGFNGTSTLSLSSDEKLVEAANIFLNTNTCAAAAAVAVLIISRIRYGKTDISMTINGTVGGLVASTAGADCMSTSGALITGILAGALVIASIEFIDHVLKTDDPVGAVSVHGACGLLGTLMVGLFHRENGLFCGGGFSQLGIQFTGAVAVAVWAAVISFAAFWIIKHTIGLRVDRDAEIAGLDRSEHGIVNGGSLSSIYEFTGIDTDEKDVLEKIDRNKYTSDRKMRNVVIITRENKLDELKNALNQIGISGFTVSPVLGCGIQRGHAAEFFRGSEANVSFIPKIRVEVVISEVPLRLVLDTAREVLNTGNIGDGKIFVYSVDDVLRVRTNEEGPDAL